MSDSFTEISPGGIIVPVSGKQIEAFGVSLRSLASILMQYPALIDVLFEKGKRPTIRAEDIARAAPDAVTDIILHGVRMASNKKAREIADNLPAGEQLMLLGAVIKRTIGEGGIGPLVVIIEEIAEMGGPVMGKMNGSEAAAETHSPQATN